MLNSITGMPMKEKIEKRQLSELEISEISLVRKGANKKKFLFFKSSDSGSCIDLLDTLEAIEENYSVTAEESEAIEKAIQTLSVLETADVDALSNVILLLSQLIANEPDETPVAKQQTEKLWPSFYTGAAVSKAESEEEEELMSEERQQESLDSTFGPAGHDADSILGDDDNDD